MAEGAWQKTTVFEDEDKNRIRVVVRAKVGKYEVAGFYRVAGQMKQTRSSVSEFESQDDADRLRRLPREGREAGLDAHRGRRQVGMGYQFDSSTGNSRGSVNP